MPQVDIPNFLEPTTVWVRCESYRSLPSNEIACEIQRIYGGTGLVITVPRYFEDNGSGARVWALQIGTIQNGQGKLVDFPSGERIAVPADKVEAPQGGIDIAAPSYSPAKVVSLKAKV